MKRLCLLALVIFAGSPLMALNFRCLTRLSRLASAERALSSSSQNFVNIVKRLALDRPALDLNQLEYLANSPHPVNPMDLSPSSVGGEEGHVYEKLFTNLLKSSRVREEWDLIRKEIAELARFKAGGERKRDEAAAKTEPLYLPVEIRKFENVGHENVEVGSDGRIWEIKSESGNPGLRDIESNHMVGITGEGPIYSSGFDGRYYSLLMGDRLRVFDLQVADKAGGMPAADFTLSQTVPGTTADARFSYVAQKTFKKRDGTFGAVLTRKDWRAQFSVADVIDFAAGKQETFRHGNYYESFSPTSEGVLLSPEFNHGELVVKNVRGETVTKFPWKKPASENATYLESPHSGAILAVEGENEITFLNIRSGAVNTVSGHSFLTRPVLEIQEDSHGRPWIYAGLWNRDATEDGFISAGKTFWLHKEVSMSAPSHRFLRTHSGRLLWIGSYKKILYAEKLTVIDVESEFTAEMDLSALKVKDLIGARETPDGRLEALFDADGGVKLVQIYGPKLYKN